MYFYAVVFGARMYANAYTHADAYAYCYYISTCKSSSAAQSPHAQPERTHKANRSISKAVAERTDISSVVKVREREEKEECNGNTVVGLLSCGIVP